MEYKANGMRICERCGDLPAAEGDTVCENCRMILAMLRKRMYEENADDPIGFDRSDEDWYCSDECEEL